MFEVIRHLHWTTSRKPGLTLLGLWVLFFFAVHLSVAALNKITVPVIGLPLGFYVAVQGSLVLFVAMVIWFAKRVR
jgi:putative solute:sodium symporter small subunit